MNHAAASEAQDMPSYLRWSMTFINRIGFPAVAFLIMAYMCFVTIDKQRMASEAQTRAIIELTAAVRDLKK